PPCQGVATPAAGAVAPAGDSPLWAPYSRPPLRAPRCKRLCPRTTTAPCGRLPPLAGAAGLPFGLALAVASRPLARGLSCGLAKKKKKREHRKRSAAISHRSCAHPAVAVVVSYALPDHYCCLALNHA
ncbi:hypothetical protein BHM03_00053659, partial [Ensete ventricosum]